MSSAISSENPSAAAAAAATASLPVDKKKARAILLLRSAAVVCFDVDSTVQLDESIDVLAAVAGKGPEVSALTASAMNGAMKFEDTLKVRLDMIQPSRKMVADCLAAHPPRLSPGVAELVARLHKLGKLVFLVSGGFSDLIMPIADMLEIPRDRVYANVLRFHESSDESAGGRVEGAYAGFDPNAFTSRSGGKAKAVQHIKANVLKQDEQRSVDHNNNNSSSCSCGKITIMVGDGATDMEARIDGAADCFIGYGGVTIRDKVREGADWFVTDFREVLAVLQ